MPNITEVTFYFANPMQDNNGDPVFSEPPESHTLTWEQVTSNAGFSLSTGESMFTELPDPSNSHLIRLVNGFYFGTGVYGSLLGIQYKYDDQTDGWISAVQHESANSKNLIMTKGNWIKGLSYQEVTEHEMWIGKPYIGLENDYVEVTVQRVIPEIFVSLSPLNKIILKGESVTFAYSTVDYCDGEVTYAWNYNNQVIDELSKTVDTHILQFKQAGSFLVEVVATNTCGQTTKKVASITVNEPQDDSCDLQLTPSNATIRLGSTVTFNAIHPYVGTGTWVHDSSMIVLEKTSKLLQVKPVALGSYSVSYKIDTCQSNALLYVLEPVADGEWTDPKEPLPPVLPDTPPETAGTPSLVIDLMDASKPIPPMHMYPNIMKRNSRYRGHRESEKVLNDHQEQIYDIRKLHKEIATVDEMKDTTIHSWFHGIETTSISMNAQEIGQNWKDLDENSVNTDLDTVRVFESDMIQLSGNSFEERIVGIYGIKRRMQELDERIAEAERRYRDYENAYE